MNLREKVLALVRSYPYNGAHALTVGQRERDIALAVAALVAEDCARACDDRAIVYDGLEAGASTRYFADKMRGAQEGCETSAAAIRDRAKTLGSDA